MTRMEVARYVAENLKNGRSLAVDQAAAWLVSTGKTRQSRYLVRDVAAIIARTGHVFVIVTTARPMSIEARRSIEAFVKTATGAHAVELQMEVDPMVVGGVRIETPTAVLDSTVHTKLANLVEGMSR